MISDMQDKCLHNRNDKCYFLCSAPSKCELCFNFVSSDDDIKKEYHLKKRIFTLYDVIKKDPKYRRMFPSSDDIQKTLF